MADHFLYKGLHWGNVNNLETIEIKLVWIFVLPPGELVENSEHGVVVKLKLFVRHEMPSLAERHPGYAWTVEPGVTAKNAQCILGC